MPAFGVIQRRNNKTAILAGQYETAYYNYVTGLGGTVIDRQYVFDKYRYFIENDLMRDLEHYSSPRAGVLLSSNAVTNLLQSSHRLNTGVWVAEGLLSRTQNATDYLGNANTAWTLIEDASSTRHCIYQAVTATGSGTFAFAVDLKAGTTNGATWASISINRDDATTWWATTRINLSTGAITLDFGASGTTGAGGGSVAAIRKYDLGNGWYRLILAGSAGGGTIIRAYVGLASDATTVTAGERGMQSYTSASKQLLVARPQLQTGSIATDYIDTRNLFRNSGVPYNDGRAVTDTLSGINLYTATSSVSTELYYGGVGTGNTNLFSVVSGAVYTFSMYAKRGTATSFTARLIDTVGGALSAVSSGVSVSVEGGRVSVTLTATSSGTGQIYLSSSAGTTVLMGGLQLELGSTASDYLATTTTASSTQSQSFYQRGFDMSHPLERNQAQYSENLVNSYWSADGETSTAISAVVGPNNTGRATLFIESGISERHYIERAAGISFVAGSRVTASVYVKKYGTDRPFAFIGFNNVPRVCAVFNLDTLSYVRQMSSTSAVADSYGIENAGDGWYRIWVSCAAGVITSSGIIFGISDGSATAIGGIPSYAGNGTSGMYFWGAQHQEGTLTAYTPTQRNLLLKSEEFRNTTWSKTNLTVSSDQELSPFNTLKGTKLTGVAGVSKTILQVTNLAVSTQYTFSVYVKYNSGVSRRVVVESNNNGSLRTAYFLFGASNETVTIETNNHISGVSRVTSVGNGFYKLEVTFTTGAGATQQFYGAYLGEYGSSNTVDFTLFGAQLELGAVASDYQYTNIVEFSHPRDLLQTATTSQPYWGIDAETGFRVPMYDGINDVMSVGHLGIYNNQPEGTLVSLGKDFNRTGGDTTHSFVNITGGTGLRRARNTSVSTGFFSVQGRREDGGANTQRDSASNANFVDLIGLFNWVGDILTAFFNGAVSTNTSFGGGGNTSLTNSTLFAVGAETSSTSRLNGIVADVIAFRKVLTTAQVTELRRRLKTTYTTLP